MAQSALPQPGDLIGGKYRIERMLGRGGMGVVYEASHCVTDKRFAIKWLLADPAVSEAVTARFIREAQVAGRCDHRNIVAVYDIDREAGNLFMVMELLLGESLADRLTLHGRLAYREACRLLVPCVEAVGEAHDAGIIHRDLKPGNIFVCRARGREAELAKVLDFGVSRFTVPTEVMDGTKTANGAVLGTPYYMAPEQMRGHQIDKRVDVYSMGVTLYEVLAGVRPYDAAGFGDLLVKVTSGQKASLKTLMGDVPVGLSDVVDRAMANDPDARYPDMEALARALEPFVGAPAPLTDSQRSSLSGDTPWVAEPESSGHGRRKSLSIGIGVALLLGAAVSVPLLTRRSDPETPPIKQPVVTTDTTEALGTSTPPDSPNVPTSPPSAAGPQIPEVQPEQVQWQPSVAPDAGVPESGKSPRRYHAARGAKSGTTGSSGRGSKGDADPDDTKSSAREPRVPTSSKARAPAKLDRHDFD